jgi:biotin carboxyl carrier protein
MPRRPRKDFAPSAMVKVGQVLCIIEAMKMNQIESDFAGKVKAILVKR